MSWMSKLLFWRDPEPAPVPEVTPVPGYEIDGCFVAPEEVTADTEALSSSAVAGINEPFDADPFDDADSSAG